MEVDLPSPPPPEELIHNGRNINFDALEANRALQYADTSVTSREAAIPVDLVWRDLTFDVPLPRVKKSAPAPESSPLPELYEPTPVKAGMRRVLHGVNGQVRTGQVLAIMGPSGSGKTTMLNLLSGRMKSSSKCISGGKIFVNGASRDFASFRHIAKFVEQDDTTMFAELTVREQIMYAARLALPNSVSEAHKRARVEKIIQELGLSKCADTYIGSHIVRGVSGGERRRASIGVELVTDPSLIFLDEPTTGLDSFSSLNVMASLRHLARNGRTIVTTIHQPRSSIFHLFDMLCLIASGRIVYFGPAQDVATHFASLGFHSPREFNIADFVIDVLSIDPRTKDKEEKSTARERYLADVYRQHKEPEMLEDTKTYENDHTVKEIANVKNFSNNLLTEFSILAHRTVRLMSRERQINFTRLGQTLFFSVLLGIIWLDSGREKSLEARNAVTGILFFVVINQCFDAAFGIIFSFPAEKAIVNRERASGYYRDISYFVGKQLCELPRAAFFNLLLLVIVYFMTGLNPTAGAFFTLLLICVILALSGEGLAQAISVFAGNEQMAAGIVPVAVILQVLFGGFFIPPSALPSYIAWGRWLSFIYYGFNAAALNEFVGRGDPATTEQGIQPDDIIIDELESDLSKWENIAVLAGYMAILKLMYFVALTANKPRFDRKM